MKRTISLKQVSNCVFADLDTCPRILDTRLHTSSAAPHLLHNSASFLGKSARSKLKVSTRVALEKSFNLKHRFLSIISEDEEETSSCGASMISTWCSLRDSHQNATLAATRYKPSVSLPLTSITSSVLLMVSIISCSFCICDDSDRIDSKSVLAAPACSNTDWRATQASASRKDFRAKAEQTEWPKRFVLEISVFFEWLSESHASPRM
mmetsp:Transcript_32240/g.77067  ORF Transcript_32240/g.77067 Transcript_32240/m.77067 type:complete len:208 (-) Transcript_32240:5395-6018(-)